MNNQSGTGTSKHCCLTAILLTVLTWTLSLFWLSAIDGDDGDQSEDCSLYQLYIYSVNVNWHSINSIRSFYLVECRIYFHFIRRKGKFFSLNFDHWMNIVEFERSSTGDDCSLLYHKNMSSHRLMQIDINWNQIDFF